MTMELSVARISHDGSDFEIMSKDAGYASDADRLQSLLEAKQGRYSSLFVIERDTKSEATEGGRDDLWAIRDYPGGVYILISDRLSEQNRRSVFIGMAGFNEKMFGPYEKQTGINLQLEGAGRFMTLAQCLEEQNENAPKNMKHWDLAIVIPEEEHALQLFAVLYYIFDKAEGFIVRTKVNEEASDKTKYMNAIAQRYWSSIKRYTFFSLENLNDILEVILESGLGVLVKIAVEETVQILRKKREDSKEKKENSQKGKKEEEESEEESSDIDANNDSEDSNDENFVNKQIEFLNKVSPRKFNYSQRRKVKIFAE